MEIRMDLDTVLRLEKEVAGLQHHETVAISSSEFIGWTNATWNPVRGCERVSEGCRNCYAEVLAARHSYEGGWGEQVAKWVTDRAAKRGALDRRHRDRDRMLTAPLKWREPRRIFVNSMSDLFHDRVPFDVVDEGLRRDGALPAAHLPDPDEAARAGSPTPSGR
jgi:protein gp37